MLYERVLGHDAALLHPQVAALHVGAGPVRADGWMRVARGSGLPSRLVATLLRLPRPGATVRVRLRVTRRADQERWVRAFGDGAVLRSRQSASARGELVERIGPVAFVFALDTTGGVLRFRQRCCQLRLWRRGVRLPRAWAPHVEAMVGPAPGDGVAVSVRVATRQLGLVLAYQGTVDVRRTSDANRLVAAGSARVHRRV